MLYLWTQNHSQIIGTCPGHPGQLISQNCVCDYKEYLELALLLLGGFIDRKKGYTYQIQRPGADHHARWMSKAIYILKLCPPPLNYAMSNLLQFACEIKEVIVLKSFGKLLINLNPRKQMFKMSTRSRFFHYF